MSTLTAEDYAFYQSHGYLVLRNFFDAAAITPCRMYGPPRGRRRRDLLPGPAAQTAPYYRPRHVLELQNLAQRLPATGPPRYLL